MASVIVTGAGSGIGAATCRRLAAQGVDLVIHTGSRVEAAHAVAAECHAVRCQVVVGDLADASTAEALMSAVQALEGSPDLGRGGAYSGLRGVVANAGFADRRSLAELDDAAMERSLDTLVVALARLMRLSLPWLQAGGRGRFVAVSSFVAHRVSPASSAFAASAAAKAGVEALVRAAASEVAAHGVTVNAVVPGYVRKDRPQSGALSDSQWLQAAARIPAGRLATPDDIAGAIMFLLGADAAYITGQLLHVDGGLTL